MASAASGSGDLAPPPPLGEIARLALFLDFDGTLVDLAATPDGIDVPDHLAAALERKAAQLDGRLAVVTGRFIDDIRGHLPECSVVMSGSHGAEVTSPDGSPVAEREVPRVSDDVIAETRNFAGSVPGLVVEKKALGVGMHYRECPDRADDILSFARDLAARHGLHLREGKMLAELTTTDANKGDGVRHIMRNAPFAGATPVFVGDDLTDEDGFAAVEDLGGFGVLVGEMRETKARYRLFDVEAVHQWLELE
ncbi:trehalose-phosphatase [Alteriqipengyuania sp. 357]